MKRKKIIQFIISLKKKGIIIFIIGFLLVFLIFWGIRFLNKLEGKPPVLTPQELKEKLLKDAKPALGNPDFLIILESEKIGTYEKPRFEIQYQAPFDLFLISLYDRPLDEVRKEAEESLLKMADGNLNTLCQLNFLVGSPRYVHEGEVIKNPETLNICLK